MTRTRLRADWVVGYQKGSHKILRDGAVVIEDDLIVYVGPAESSPSVDHDVDYGPGSFITPGMISTHAHISGAPAAKTVTEDAMTRQFSYNSLVETLMTLSEAADPAGRMPAAKLSAAEYLRTGCTTILQVGVNSLDTIEAIRPSGLRAYFASSFRSGYWHTPDGKRVDYGWYPDQGAAEFDEACAEVQAVLDLNDPMYRPMLAPAQVETCTEDLLLQANRAAEAFNVPITLHAAQGMSEFREMVSRHGRTPIEWLADIGVLSPRMMIAHAVYIAGHSWTNFHGDDLALLADSGTSVSLNTWTFARHGVITESFGKYLDAGVRVTLGTDSATQSMIESLKWTAVLGKIADRRADVATSNQVFDAATIHAADYLGRADLGRLAPGAQADIVCWRSNSQFLSPTRDPIRSLVFHAQAEDVRDVYVAGKLVVKDANVLGINVEEQVEKVRHAAETAFARWSSHDRLGRTIEEALGTSYPDWDATASEEMIGGAK